MKLEKGKIYRIRLPFNPKLYMFYSAFDSSCDVAFNSELMVVTKLGLAIGKFAGYNDDDQSIKCTACIVDIPHLSYYKSQDLFFAEKNSIKNKLNSL